MVVTESDETLTPLLLITNSRLVRRSPSGTGAGTGTALKSDRGRHQDAHLDAPKGEEDRGSFFEPRADCPAHLPRRGLIIWSR